MLSHNLPECALSELLYADDLVLMSEAIEGFRNKLLKWKEDFESKGLHVNLFENQNNGQQRHLNVKLTHVGSNASQALYPTWVSYSQ